MAKDYGRRTKNKSQQNARPFNKSHGSAMDLSQYNKTVLVQSIQASSVRGAIDHHGAQTIFSTNSNSQNTTITNNKPITYDGIEMGNQTEVGIIPIVYGHVGMAGTQFNKGQTVSDVDSEKTRLTIKVPISEGPIVGLSHQASGTVITNSNIYITPELDNPQHAKAVIINRINVVDPLDDKAKFEDIELKLTKGDGTTATYQSFTITDIEPIITEPVTGADVPLELEKSVRELNDLTDVSATDKGPDSIIYWNSDNGKWESKSLAILLQDVNLTSTGGTGGTGGGGGDAGDGGTGGTGGVGSFSEAIYYTQWNPPPSAVRVVYSGSGAIVNESDVVTTTTVTDPPILTATVTSDGAPLRNIDQETPEFSCNMSFGNVDEKVKELSIIMNFPDGLYKEIKTETETKTNPNPHADLHHEIKICDSVREPLANQGANLVDARGDVDSTGGGDLECLNPYRSIDIVTVADGTAEESYQKATVITKTTGYLWVHYVLTTELCDREFVLDESSYEISDTQLSAWKHKHTLALADMNAGSGAQLTGDLRGTHKLGPFSDIENADCDSETVENFNWDEYELDDYLDMYPGQIISSVTGDSKIKIYTWIENRYFSYDTKLDDTTVKDDEYTLSTNCYFKEVKIEKEMDAFENYYSVGNTDDSKPFQLGEPDHSWRWGRRGGGLDLNNFKSELTAEDYELEAKRIQSGFTGGAYLDFSYPVPLAIMANINPGSSGNTGTDGDPGEDGTVGQSGTSGTVTVATVDPIPTVTCQRANYDSDLTPPASRVITLSIFVANTNTTEVNTLTIKVPTGTGTLDTVTSSGVSVSGADTDTLILAATASVLQTCLDSGIEYSISSGISGDQEVDLNIIGTVSSKSTQAYCHVFDLPLKQKNSSALHHANEFVETTTNTLVDPDISWAEIIYRPKQDEEEINLEEVAFIIGGRDDMEAPSENGISLTSWISSDYVSATKTWTNNTAWIFWDYLQNETYGLGADIIMDDDQKEVLYSEIYRAAQWCSHEPTEATISASTFNGVIFGAESKIDALQKMASSMNSKFLFINGNPRLLSDATAYSWTDGTYTNYPEVKKIVNQTNASNLSYSGGSMENIFNVINVKWNNPDNYHKLETVPYENAASITKYNRREKSVELFGCANKQQAYWYGAWDFETNHSNSDTVNYMAGWDHYDVIPGDLISLADEYRPASSDKGGRVVSDDGSTVTLDRAATSGPIAIMDTNGFVQHGTASGTTATISGTFDPGAVWNSYTGTDEPLAANYRIIAIEESEDGLYTVTACNYDYAKYDRVWLNTI
jgi:hypothetical protein